MPCDLVVKNASKIRSTSLGSMPAPLSSTDSNTPSGLRVYDRSRATFGRCVTDHGVKSIHNQVENNLLQLDTNANHLRRLGLQFSFDQDFVPPHLHKGKHVLNKLIDIERNLFLVNCFEHRSYALDNLTSTMAVNDDAIDSRPRGIEVRSRMRESASRHCRSLR